MAKFKADGTVVSLSVEDAAGTAYGSATFNTLGQITDIAMPGIERPLIDVTDISDTLRDYLLGIADPGEGSLTINWDPGTTSAYTYAKAALTAGEKRYLRFVLSDSSNTEIHWTVFITSVGEIQGSEGDKISTTIGFKGLTDITVV